MRGPDRGKVRTERRLRRALTDAERKLWFALRDRRLDGHKFVRQEAIGPYIVDFVCREKKLVIEVDGEQHAENAGDRSAVLEFRRTKEQGRRSDRDLGRDARY
jgi:very-short-patch-repair endonuclease